jgi:hypothetical protein
MKINLTSANYNFPLGEPDEGAYLTGVCGVLQIVDPADWGNFERDYYAPFLRYLYFICLQNAEGEYPENLGAKEICEKLTNFFKNKKCTSQSIKSILIAESPSLAPVNYFYNLVGAPGWDAAGTFCGEIRLALGIAAGITKTKFLVECAKCGFIVLDLFPFVTMAIPAGRQPNAYQTAVKRAWGFCPSVVPYPMNIRELLDFIFCCLNKNLSVGFSLPRFGNVILNDLGTCTEFNNWLTVNAIVLNPAGAVEILRVPAVVGRSKFLRICWQNGYFAPHHDRMNEAGIFCKR